MQVQLWGFVGAFVALTAFANFADRKRQNRKDLDKVGFMPWTLITLFSVMAALVLTAVALKLHQ
ncbi:hypothetical protein [Sphingomonas cavernae]|uniref:Uncharacterized protein n=1 Tax=Sphingomonas cavernae TaxID=2320861 RepID=A0A418W674_9SPHN|nr:hypothetical protein [Sphingomonas cavernae]RJF85533.1 hypothetical protein D3876_16540 [Sphingomonas cavernae]